MTYLQSIKYLESFINYERVVYWSYKESLKLERFKDFLDTIDNPQRDLRCIHIAGTKGKGSTCAFIAYILREAGFKVGLYTSPHLSDFRERIRILTPYSKSQTQSHHSDFEGMIQKRQLVDLVEGLKPAIESYNKVSRFGPLSFFEIYTALAFIYFKEERVDFAVLETGLGGRLDATNVVEPLVCAITPISYEHTQKLGNTLREIAQEKVGIIKGHQLTVIGAPQQEEVDEVIRERCRMMDVRLYQVGKDIIYNKTKNKLFKVKGILNEYKDLKLNLLGEHQIINAAVAIGAIEALQSNGIKISHSTIRRGLYNTVWPGRCEIISRHPLIVLDGAQNAASAKALKEAVRALFNFKRLFLVLGVSKDKDIKGICEELVEIADEIILSKADNPRASQPENIRFYIKTCSDKKIFLTRNSKEAIELAKARAGTQDLILVTGSLFLVGEIRSYLLKNKRRD